MARSPRGESYDPQQDRPHPWRRRQRDVAYVAWASFLMACAASAVFFAMVDPQVLSGTTTPGWEISRQEGYAIGFFGFWLLTAATGAFVLWLVRTENDLNEGQGPHCPPHEPQVRRPRRGLMRRRQRHDRARGREERP